MMSSSEAARTGSSIEAALLMCQWERQTADAAARCAEEAEAEALSLGDFRVNGEECFIVVAD